MKTKNTSKFLAFFLMCITVTMLSGCEPRNTLPEPYAEHKIVSASSLTEVWTQITYSMQKDYMSPLGAASGKVCYLGAMTNQGNHDVFCLDGLTGKMLWQEKSDGISRFLVTNNSVYLARSGGLTGVGRFDLGDGSLVWYQSVQGSGISYLSVLNNEVQVLAVPHKLFGLDITNGEIVKQYSKDTHTFLHTSTEAFILQPKFSAISSQTGEILWVTRLGDTLLQAPVVLDDIVLVRTGRVKGTVFSINRKTGDIFWKTSDNIISNIAYSVKKQKIFVLDKEGNLQEIDIRSGKEEVLLKFSSVPFILNGEKIVGGYELAYDDSVDMLFVLLGDSRQLFAFQVE